MSKYVVPEGGLQVGRAAYSAYVTAEGGARRILEAFIAWQSENPPVPTELDVAGMCGALHGEGLGTTYPSLHKWLPVEWIRRMYLAEPEVPEAIKGMQKIDFHSVQNQEQLDSALMPLMLEVYRRGQASK